jgi:hypothetical protein
MFTKVNRRTARAVTLIPELSVICDRSGHCPNNDHFGCPKPAAQIRKDDGKYGSSRQSIRVFLPTYFLVSLVFGGLLSGYPAGAQTPPWYPPQWGGLSIPNSGGKSPSLLDHVQKHVGTMDNPYDRYHDPTKLPLPGLDYHNDQLHLYDLWNSTTLTPRGNSFSPPPFKWFNAFGPIFPHDCLGSGLHC